MTLENESIIVEFGELPFPVRYTSKRSGQSVGGVLQDATLAINGEACRLSDVNVAREPEAFQLSFHGHSLRFAFSLQDECLLYRVSVGADSAPVESIDMSGMPLLNFGEDFRYAKDTYVARQWHAPIGRGLYHQLFDCGPVIGAWPRGMEACVHACGFKDALCAFVRTSYAEAPLAATFYPHPRLAQRSGGLGLGIHQLFFDLGDRRFESWDFSIHVIGDLNGDGKADECDYQLALKKWLPTPSPLYRDAVWYKIMCAVNGYTHTTFAQALEIVRYIHRVTTGAKQIVYLVGWQYTGHDTGYPSVDRINPAAGTREDLLALMTEARERCNCTISLHINVDDSYPGNPGWREDLICRDVDGRPMTWEIFGQLQAYHICHTKDVRSRDIFRRIDDLLTLVPVTESIHIDAFRNTNSSWEENEFIGPDKELYCGQLPIIEHFARRGIDVTTESLNGMRIEPAGVFSALWHLPLFFPILYQGVLFGGGSRDDPVSVATGSSLNHDFTAGMLARRSPILRAVVMRNMLYRFMLRRTMVEYRTGGIEGRAWVRFDDGTQTNADNAFGMLEMRLPEGTLVADATSRFIPLDGYLYAFQTVSGVFRRVLPRDFRGVPLRCAILTECSDWLEFRIDGDHLHMALPADTLVRFERA